MEDCRDSVLARLAQQSLGELTQSSWWKLSDCQLGVPKSREAYLSLGDHSELTRFHAYFRALLSHVAIASFKEGCGMNSLAGQLQVPRVKARNGL